MTPREAARWIRASVRYKPGYTLHATCPSIDRLEISVSVPTGVDSNGQTTGRYDVTYVERFTEEYLAWHQPEWIIDIVRDFLFRWEQHECEEWLTVDGVKARDPHTTSVNFLDGRPI